MAEGTINLVNNSTTLTGVGTDFASKVTPGDFIYVEVATVPYTLPVDVVNSDSSITLLRKFTGPTASGLVWVHIPRRAQNAVYSALVDQVSQALLQALTNEDNWQQLLTGEGDVTITRPDGSTYTGPSWIYVLNNWPSLNKGNVWSEIQTIRGLVVGNNVNGNVGIELGSLITASSSHIDFHSSGNGNDYDSRIIGTGGTENTSQGTLSFIGGKLIFQAPEVAFTNPTGVREKLLAVGIGDYGIGAIMPAGVGIAQHGESTVTGFTASANDGANELGINASDLTTLVMNRGMRPTRIHQSYSNRRTWFSYYSGAAWNYYEAYTTGNTTKASDGTLKAASPVVKVFSNGSYETNDESEGVTVSRLDVGQYLIEGCEALNSDAVWGGWDGGFDIPTDRNKQPLIWLDYDVNPDGSVLVKTYHRTHPESPEFARNRIGYKNDAGDFIETVANGDPVDIPSDQFVSVRVEMPQDSIWNQRQKEIAEMMDAETSNQQSTTDDEAAQD